jgi:hypothetical protein
MSFRFPLQATLAVAIVCISVLVGVPASAQRSDTADYDQKISDVPIPSRAEAAEMGDQRQREILRGPYRNEVDRTRGRDQPAPEMEQPKYDDYDSD